jgi:long-chain acyl-CoA synthetase
MQTTFPQLLLNHASQRPGDTAMREKEYGIWQAISWADMATLVKHLACIRPGCVSMTTWW